jgi:Uma2 family endonuclease
MEALKRPPRTGMEAFKLMPEGTLCQLINDELIMSPAPLIKHARVQNLIFTILYNWTKSEIAGEVFCAPIDVYLNKKNAFQPDVLFISEERKSIIKENGVYGAPDLVIEILSKGTQKFDLVKKKEVYEQTGVKEYWVVDPETKRCKGFALETEKFKSLGEATGVIKLNLVNLTIHF